MASPHTVRKISAEATHPKKRREILPATIKNQVSKRSTLGKQPIFAVAKKGSPATGACEALGGKPTCTGSRRSGGPFRFYARKNALWLACVSAVPMWGCTEDGRWIKCYSIIYLAWCYKCQQWPSCCLSSMFSYGFPLVSLLWSVVHIILQYWNSISQNPFIFLHVHIRNTTQTLLINISFFLPDPFMLIILEVLHVLFHISHFKEP